MATENQKTILQSPDQGHVQDNSPEVPADSELFAGRVYEAHSKADDSVSETQEGLSAQEVFVGDSALGAQEGLSSQEVFAGDEDFGTQEGLSAQEVFAGDEDFYKYLANMAKPAKAEEPAVPGFQEVVSIPHKRFSTIQKVLAASIVLIVAVLLHALLKSPSAPVVSQPPAGPAQQTSPSEPSVVVESIRTTPQQVQETEFVPEATQPLSLKVAQRFYLNGDYTQALGVYEKLCQNLPLRPEGELMRDFLQMQMALCIEKTGDCEQAIRLFRAVSHSRSPLVRVFANYRRSLLEMQKKQYLEARTKAYQVITLIDAVNFDKDWALALRRNCYLLVAEAVTRKVLWLCDGDKDLPENSWGDLEKVNDTFTRLNEAQLRTILKSGSDRLSEAVFGPQIQQLGHQGGMARYDVTCNGASIEELLIRFAANAGLDIHWVLEPTEIGVRKRAVSLHLSAATTQQSITAAAGCVGLLARLNENGVVDIFNPAKYSYVSEQIYLLSAEAVSLWQKFLLRFPEDAHLANAHFTLGFLQAQQGRYAEPIAEYKLVANRFSNSSLAPLALLNSSKLKTKLRDHSGARQDLKQLVEQYPDTEIAGKAYLCLADATAKAGLKGEAARLYSKVYNLNLSAESQIAAALGAGRCYHEIKDCESTTKWLTRYVTLGRDSRNKDLYSAYFLLGKSYLALGNSEAACDAFQHAIQGGLSRLTREEYIETVSALVEGYMQQGHFVQALDTLEDIHSVLLSPQESTAILLLKSKVFRAIGLVDKAIAILGDRAKLISNPQLKAKVALELADCYVNRGNFELARKELAEILIVIEPGSLVHKIALKLAAVCLKLGQNSQAASICLQLLDLEPPEQIKQKTLNLLATVYNQQKDYDRAALALLGQWK
ncbi:MAG: tetratricopeptide repeat protein [Planctomycetota bacterium]|jgi:tetratricopeptide (TPR) repeat protein